MIASDNGINDCRWLLSLLNALAVPLDLHLNLVVLPHCLYHVAIFVGQLAQAVLASILEVAVVEVSADHGGAVALSAVVAPLTVVVVAILPSVNALALLLSPLEVALVLVALLVLHDSESVVLALEERAAIDTVSLLYVNSFTAELVVLPAAFVLVSFLVDHFSLPVFHSAFPLASISSVASFFNAFSVAVAFEEVAVVHRLADEWIFALAWVFLALHYHLHAFAALEVVLELADVDHVLGVAQFSAAVVLAFEEGALVHVAVFVCPADQLALSVRLPVQHFSVVISPASFRVNVHIFLSAFVEVLVLLFHNSFAFEALLVAVDDDAGHCVEHFSHHAGWERSANQLQMQQVFLVAAGPVLPVADDLVEFQLMGVLEAKDVFLALAEVLHLVAETSDRL